MYLPGHVGNFAARLHQLPSTVNDVDDFVSEGDTYLNSVPVYMSGKWEREARKRKYLITSNGSYLSTQQFGLGTGSLEYILDVGDSEILDINNLALEAV